MASTSLTWTPSGAGSQQKTTLSMWLKKSKPDNAGYIFEVSDGSNQFVIRESNAQIKFWHFAGSSYDWEAEISPLLRDISGWYHFVMSIDTTQSTLANRLKCWLNGVSQTVTFTSGSSNLSQNSNWIFNKNSTHRWGRADNSYWDGLMTHIHQTDGYCYDASTFGQTDSTTGEWSIINEPTIANYGTNGYFILKNGNSVTDQSPNSNNFAVATGTLTKTEDNPSNVFATINRLLGSDVVGSTVNFSNGNTTAEDPNGSASGINPIFMSSLGMPSKGKWYCEVQPSSFSTSSGHSIGLVRTKGATDDSVVGGNTNKLRYIFADTAYYIIKYGTNDQTGLSAISSGATVGLALDLDNGTFQYYVDGSARANQITGINSANDGYDYFFMMDLESSSSGRYGNAKFNFGNGAFGSTQLTGTTYQDSNGRGIFKHQPPTNFLALCTKNLNE